MTPDQLKTAAAAYDSLEGFRQHLISGRSFRFTFRGPNNNYDDVLNVEKFSKSAQHIITQALLDCITARYVEFGIELPSEKIP